MTSPIIYCAEVSYRYRDGTAALAGLNLAVAPGEFVVLAGASGSGKSTLCRLLTGLVPHLHGGDLTGTAVVDGQEVRATPPARLGRSVGLVLQNPEAQVVGTTVARDLAFGPACQGLDRATIDTRVSEVAESLAITHLLDREPHTLSSGEQQRVALAGVLALRPKLLALDEPFAFLDAAGARQLRAILDRLHRQGITIVVAEHRLRYLVDCATRLVVLDGGRVVADGPPAAVLAGDVAAWGLEPPLPSTGDGAAGDRQTRRPCPGADTPAVVEWDDVWFDRDGRPVLRGVTLRAPAGRVLALVGPNGAGKTTLLRHANGLLRPRRGTVRVLGRPVGRRPVGELAGEVGLVMPQPLHMLFAPTVREEIAAGPRALRRHDPAWCRELSERFGLGRLLDRVPQRLSAGEQRRVAVAAVLAARPRALLLDEPTAGLDGGGRRTLAGLVRQSAADGTAVVVASHDAAWLVPLADCRAGLVDGRIEGGGA